MIAAIATLLMCQLVGEILVRVLAVPLPGPVAGLVLLFAGLALRGRRVFDPAEAVPEDLGRVADTLLRNLSLLFIPAAVGVVQYVGLIRAFAGPIAAAIAGSTLVTLVITAAVFRLVSRLHAFRHKSLVGELEAAAGFEDAPRAERRP